MFFFLPLQLIIGRRDLSEGVIEFKNRLKNSSSKIPIQNVENTILKEINI